MYICVGKLTIIISDNGLLPGWRQAVISSNAGILLIGSLGANISEILIKIDTFPFQKIHLKMSSGKWRPSCVRPQCVNKMNSAQQKLTHCGLVKLHGIMDLD